MAVLVAALPTSPPNLLLNPWAHADGDNTTPSHVHWSDDSSGGNVISVSKKVTEPTPYAELDGAELATAFRLADTIGEDGGGQADSGGLTGILTQVVASNSALLRLHFFMHYVSNNIETFQVIISGSDSAEGSWTELWRPYSETLKHTAMAWAAMDASPVHEKVIATGYDFLQVKVEVRFADASTQGMKWTGVYLAQSAAENPASYETLAVGTTTNSAGSARTSVSFSHNNNGDLLLLCSQILSTSTTAPTVASVQYNGVAMTEITAAQILNSYASNRHVPIRWYYLVSPPAGAHNVTATLTNSTRDSFTAISLDNADLVTVFRRTATYTTGNTANSNTHAKLRINTTRPKSIVLSACQTINSDGSPFAPDGSMTELYDTTTGSGASHMAYVSQHKTLATSDTLDAGTTSTGARQFSLSGLEILAAEVAAGGYTLTAAAGSFALTGITVGLLASRLLAGAAGLFTLTGQAATFARGFRLSAAAGSFALDGQSAVLLAGRSLTADAGAFSITGQSAGLAASRLLAAVAGEYALTGQDAALTAGRLLSAAAGAFSLTGQSATLTYSGGGAQHYTLTAAVGTFSLTGQAASLSVGRLLTASAGSYSVTGQDTDLLAGRLLAADVGSYTLTGQAAVLQRGYTLVAVVGSYDLAGQAATLMAARLLVATVATFALTGRDATLTHAGAVTFYPSGTRARRKALTRQVFLSAAPSRPSARARMDIKAEG